MADIDTAEFAFFDMDSCVDVSSSLMNTSSFLDSVTQLQIEKKSPFHESDSGLSDISEENPSWENCDIKSLFDMLDLPEEPFQINSSESDSDLQQIHSGAWNEQTNRVPVPQTVADLQTSMSIKTRSQCASLSRVLNSSGVDSPVQGSRSCKMRSQTTKKPCLVSQSDECKTDFQDVASSGKPKGSIRVKNVGERLQSANKAEQCNVTSVRVLRIVKSGNDGDTEDAISKALEERNRKNAEMARQNRLKRKEHFENLEREVEDGRKRIGELESALNDVEEERDAYRREVEYLKSVLANHSALAGLLKNIPSVSGVTLASSLSRKRVAELDHSYTPRKKSCQSDHTTSTQSAGVCLHVQNNTASLEFCHHCADMASGRSLS